jgi:ACT domain-containing protein
VENMNNKEMYLKFIKDFNNINIYDILKEINLTTSCFYTYRYSIEKMQKVTDEMRKKIKNIYPTIKNDEFVLDTKEKIVNFAKDITNISTNNITNELKVDRGALYTYRVGEAKYELVINEIKKQLDEVYEKYNK